MTASLLVLSSFFIDTFAYYGEEVPQWVFWGDPDRSEMRGRTNSDSVRLLSWSQINENLNHRQLRVPGSKPCSRLLGADLDVQ